MAPHAVFRSYRMATQATGGLAVEWEVLKQGGGDYPGLAWRVSVSAALSSRPSRKGRRGAGYCVAVPRTLVAMMHSILRASGCRWCSS